MASVTSPRHWKAKMATVSLYLHDSGTHLCEVDFSFYLLEKI